MRHRDVETLDPSAFGPNRSCGDRRKPLLTRFSLLPMNNLESRRSDRLGTAGRFACAVWGAVLVAEFALAAWLQPDSRGFGTHQQLGLPPCRFQDHFQKPCPACGLTTSFSHFIRGRFVASAQANIAGVFLAVLCAAQIPWAWHGAATGRLWQRKHLNNTLLAATAAFFVISLAQWTVRLFFLGG